MDVWSEMRCSLASPCEWFDARIVCELARQRVVKRQYSVRGWDGAPSGTGSVHVRESGEA